MDLGGAERLLNLQRLRSVFIPTCCQSFAKTLSINIPLSSRKSVVNTGNVVSFEV
jgi:hypothetical protein